MSPSSIDAREPDEAGPSTCKNGAACPENATGHADVRGRISSQGRVSCLRSTDADSIHDLLCVGFGPASLAIAVALHDALEMGALATPPKILFLEKQAQFSWHAGMLLSGAKMQISFIKDLASLRNPRSNFTFLNYLHKNDRLVEFTNLSTFLPTRAEYEDYLRWCAGHFDDVVRYNNEVLSVSPGSGEGLPLKTFHVTSRDVNTGVTKTYRARNVLVAIGGQPSVPRVLRVDSPLVIHSSEYAHLVPQILKDKLAPCRVAVVGAGQSAAEIFSNIQTLYPNSKTWLIMRSEFLKPSDDSPFVNTVFNPGFVNTLYSKPSVYRQRLMADTRATNYGVVRLDLIERLYEKMYDQMRELGKDERKWPHRIMGGRRILTVESAHPLRVKVGLSLPDEEEGQGDQSMLEEENLDVDLIIAGTGYRRSAHVDMLRDVWPYLPMISVAEGQKLKSFGDRWLVETPPSSGSCEKPASTRVMEVGRDYSVRFSPGAVAPGSGVWLQGCCEGSHGLSDTLLSVLGTRSGEIVASIFLHGAENNGAPNI